MGKDFFQDASIEQAFLRCGFLGFAGGGKTFTATKLAIGLMKHSKNDKPVFFLDTENGSDWVVPMVQAAGLKMKTKKSRAFKDLLTAVDLAANDAGIIVIDSITHFWTELMKSYLKSKNRTRLILPDWGVLKPMWADFTEKFMTAPVHIIICGRAGFEFDNVEDEDGHNVLQKTGVKMKAETEMGYEPNLLIEMSRTIDMTTQKKDEGSSRNVIRHAHILKDRSTRLDGQTFLYTAEDVETEKVFKDFKPHIDFLNLGGTHHVLDTERESSSLFDKESGDPPYAVIQRQKAIAMEDLENAFVELGLAGRSDTDKRLGVIVLKHVFGTASKTAIGNMKLPKIQSGVMVLREMLPIAVRDAELDDCPKCKGEEPAIKKCKTCLGEGVVAVRLADRLLTEPDDALKAIEAIRMKEREDNAKAKEKAEPAEEVTADGIVDPQ